MKIKITKIFLIKIFSSLLIINISKCSNFNEISLKEKNEKQIRSLQGESKSTITLNSITILTTTPTIILTTTTTTPTIILTTTTTPTTTINPTIILTTTPTIILTTTTTKILTTTTTPTIILTTTTTKILTTTPTTTTTTTPTTTPTTTTTTTPTTTIKDNGGNSTNAIIKKSSSGLSTGTICAIAIPCIAALLGAAIAASLLKGGSAASPAIGAALNSSLPPPNIISNSIDKLNVIDEIPINPQPQPQPITQQIIQPKPVEVQPVQRIIRPTYHKLEPPAVNNVFKPMYPQSQQIQMIPVQQVQMVPVQPIQTIQVQQIKTVPVQRIQTVPVQQIQTVPVQQIQTAPVQQAIPVSQVNETLPHITAVSEDIPETIVGQEVISGPSEMISEAPVIDGGITQVTQTSQVLPMQVLPTIEHGTQVLPSQVLPTIDQGAFPTNSNEGIDFSLNNQI